MKRSEIVNGRHYYVRDEALYVVFEEGHSFGYWYEDKSLLHADWGMSKVYFIDEIEDENGC